MGAMDWYFNKIGLSDVGDTFYMLVVNFQRDDNGKICHQNLRLWLTTMSLSSHYDSFLNLLGQNYF